MDSNTKRRTFVRARLKSPSLKGSNERDISGVIIGAGVEPVECGGECTDSSSWTEWGEWSPCNFLYGTFSQSRYRNCLSTSCPGGSFSEARPCVPYEAPTQWGDWTSWNDCSVACGGGTMSRHRLCNSGCSNCQCFGNSVEYQPCNTQPCCQFGPNYELLQPFWGISLLRCNMCYFSGPLGRDAVSRVEQVVFHIEHEIAAARMEYQLRRVTSAPDIDHSRTENEEDDHYKSTDMSVLMRNAFNE
ncbi:thrombospondin type 1 domain protein [Dictyocaulus viviparus]|uniref:Thrombospondin type 1 domain protein n=1 Tax=Dictyocaulus viviparus TaxID=29172 RepID=A0A0D8XBI8_DICVI|nr:thrombospondin type 1 domain protein [Dictyocaulus viviparus]